MNSSLSVEHTDISSWISRIIDLLKMGAIEDTASHNEDNQSIEYPQDEAADICEFSTLI